MCLISSCIFAQKSLMRYTQKYKQKGTYRKSNNLLKQFPQITISNKGCVPYLTTSKTGVSKPDVRSSNSVTEHQKKPVHTCGFRLRAITYSVYRPIHRVTRN